MAIEDRRERDSRSYRDEPPRDRDRGDRSDRGGDRYSRSSRHDDRGDRDRDHYRDRDRDSHRRGRGDGPSTSSSSRRDYRDYEDRPPRRGGGGGGYEGRRGGGGGGRGGDRGGDRGDRGGGGGSPERPRSPTPEGSVPLTQRRRKATGWDVHAPGYEQYSAMQAKQTGLFNLPGANRTQIPPILGIPGLPPPVPIQSFGMGMGGNPNLSRQSRRLYIGSVTPEITETALSDFFNTKMLEMGIGTGGPGNPVLAVQCNYEKSYAFVEFRSAEDATSAMAFDGIIFVNGPLKIRRPKDYGGNPLPGSLTGMEGIVSTNVPDTPNKVFVGGLPTYLSEEQVQELLTSFGELKAFHLVRENATTGGASGGVSKGFAFFEYVDVDVTDVAIGSLNGMELGDRHLVVQRASVGAPGNKDEMNSMMGGMEIPAPIMPAGGASEGSAKILLMLNMVTPEDLVDDQEYSDLLEDVKEECSKYGPVQDLRIPRPFKLQSSSSATSDKQRQLDKQRMDEAAGVGRVYVKYVSAESADAALKGLAGRSFAGRSIIATLLGEESQSTPPLHLIFAPQPEAPGEDEGAPPPMEE